MRKFKIRDVRDGDRFSRWYCRFGEGTFGEESLAHVFTEAEIRRRYKESNAFSNDCDKKYVVFKLVVEKDDVAL